MNNIECIIIIGKGGRIMKTVYVDVTNLKYSCGVGVFVDNPDIVLTPAGTTIAINDNNDYNDEYKRFADEYDIHFIFENNIPLIDFYTIPMIDIFAMDSVGGYIGTLGQSTNLNEDIPVCYIDQNKKCYLINQSSKDFINKPHLWKNNLISYDDIEVFVSKEEAENKYEFLAL